MKKASICLFICSFFFSLNLTFSQTNPSDDDNAIKKKDTVCLSYHFNKGDTLIYFVEARDSIIIDYDSPLLRSRMEHILIACDSVGSNGRFYITQIMINFLAKESMHETKNVERKESPWLGRKVQYEIDSLGMRYSVKLDDSLNAAMSPGGAFNPPLLPILGGKYKHIGESWIVNSEFDLPENGIPVPLVRMSYLIRSREPYDTLNSRCNKIEYISTGQGSFTMNSNKENITVTSILNGHGNASIDTLHNLLVHHYSTVEQKLSIVTNDNVTKPGLHFTSINYTLIDYKFANVAKPVQEVEPKKKSELKKPVNKKNSGKK